MGNIDQTEHIDDNRYILIGRAINSRHIVLIEIPRIGNKQPGLFHSSGDQFGQIGLRDSIVLDLTGNVYGFQQLNNKILMLLVI